MPSGRIVLPNRAAQDFLDEDGHGLVGTPIDEVLPRRRGKLLDAADLHPDEVVERQLTVYRGRRQRTLLVRVVAAARRWPRLCGYIVTFDDITELLSAQRQAAWAEVARRIAHEVKNPLTPIRLSAERLERKYLPQIAEDRDGFAASIATIIRQVDTIGRLINEFSAFARMPAPVLREENVAELVRDAVFLQQQAWPQISFAVELPAEPIRLRLRRPKGVAGADQPVAERHQCVVRRTAAAAPWTISVRCASRRALRCMIEVEDNGRASRPTASACSSPTSPREPRAPAWALPSSRRSWRNTAVSVELLAGEAGARWCGSASRRVPADRGPSRLEPQPVASASDRHSSAGSRPGT